VAFRDHFWLLGQPTMSRLPFRGVQTALAALPLRGPADLDNYLALVRQVPGLARLADARLAGARRETQIRSETLRYSADRPGQALAYRMGSREIHELRRRAERELGPRFDLRRFHDAVLSPGSMPLTVLEKHVDWWIGEEKKREGVGR